MTPIRFGAGVEAVHNGECVVFARASGHDEIFRVYISADEFERWRQDYSIIRQLRRHAAEAIAGRVYCSKTEPDLWRGFVDGCHDMMEAAS